MLVDVTAHPALAEALLLLGNIGAGERASRYLKLFRAYESLEKQPQLQFAAVRHALSHAQAALTRPATVAKMLELFGRKSIDLALPRHERVFYQLFVKLACEVDAKIHSALLAAWPSLTILPSARDALFPADLYGSPGGVAPMFLHDLA